MVNLLLQENGSKVVDLGSITMLQGATGRAEVVSSLSHVWTAVDRVGSRPVIRSIVRCCDGWPEANVARPDTRVPVTLLTGFLGSGKTTLLRALLAEPGMEGTAVLINEFGEIELDHLLVRSVHGDAIVLQNGCICCTLQADLQQGLRDVIDGRADGSFPNFERIVIETTGLADPSPIIQTLILDQMLKHQVRLANTIVTVDAVNGAAQLHTHIESVRQVAVADRLVVTKSDIASEASRAALRREIERLNPTARLYNSQAKDFTARALVIEEIGGSELQTRRGSTVAALCRRTIREGRFGAWPRPRPRSRRS